MTRNSCGSLCVLPPTVTCRSSIASSSAAWTLAGARFTSSASTRLAKTGPGWNLNSPRPPSLKYTSEPVTSAGSRSGVNWIRENCASRFLASALMARVLASPGKPSTSRLPLASRPSSRRSIIASCPTIDSPIRFWSASTAARAVPLVIAIVLPGLRFERLHQRLDHLVHAEARRALAGRILLEGRQERRDLPDTVLEQVRVAGEPVVVLIRDDVRALVGIHAKVEDLGRAQTREGVGPHLEPARAPLLAEHDLPVPVAIGDQQPIV